MSNGGAIPEVGSDGSTVMATSDARAPGSGSPSPSGRTIAYQPALDGVRALAVAVVLLFHAEVPGFSGGYLGVSVFFTLSGYLITSLLAAETERDGRVALGSFYARRARRLVPASLLVVLLVSVAAATTDWFDAVDRLRAHAVGSLLQVANWVFLAGDGSYQELLDQTTGTASPLEHYWSLAIEEQFYWLWPVAFVGLWRLGRHDAGRIRVVGLVTLVFVVAAPVVAAVWGADAAYWATPARAAEILLGAVAALVLRHRTVDPRWAMLAPAALLALAVCVVTFPAAGGPAYAGALPLIGLASVGLIVGLQAESATRRAVAASPLVWLGTISYGVYLFHWPVFVVLDEERLGTDGPLLLLARLVLTLVVAQVSFVAFERPIRHGLRLAPRPSLVVAGAATAAAVAAVWLLVPGPRGAYWEAEAGDVDAAAIVVDDEPLVTEPLVPVETGTDAETDTEPGTDAEIDTDPADGTASPGSTAETGAAGTPSTVADPADADEGSTGSTVDEPVGEADAPATSEAPTASAPPTTEPPLPQPSRPVRMLVAGDSTAVAVGAGVVGWAVEHPELAQVEVFAFPGCGFLRGGELLVRDEWIGYEPGCEVYTTSALPEKSQEVAADLAVLMTTSWDVFDRRWPDEAGGGETLDPTGFADRLRSDFTAVTEGLLDAGVPRVVWIEMPMPDPEWAPDRNVQEEPERHAVLHDAMASVAERYPDRVRVVDFDGWFGEAGLDDDRERRPDGVHLTPEAATDVVDEWLGERLLRAALT